jgi:predicted Fe-S protein YdhL (DUF1289 family)
MTSDHPIDTPCIAVCAIDPRCGLCIGCGRNMQEIGRWGGMSRAERLAIMATLQERRRAAGLPDDPFEDDVGDEPDASK